MFGKGHENPENIVLTRQKDFSYRLVRQQIKLTMGPTLILDKSAFHALSSHEMHKIAEYFCWNRLDILLLEIIGDFSKQIKTTSSRNEAAILADKVSLFDSYQNVDYISLFLGNLLGKEVVMDGRPIIAPDTINKLDNGSVGALIDDTRFCEMIYRWQRGNFNKEDAALSELWQGVKGDCKEKAINYLDLLRTNHIVFPTCTSITELEAEVGKLIRNPKVQLVLLNMLLSYQGVKFTQRNLIIKRLKQHQYSLQTVAPYAFYCLKVFTLFLGAYKHDLLIRKKADDQIDLEYLFYLPFCHVFSSNDNFHIKLAPHLIRNNQVFLPGNDLKKGIREIDTLPRHEETMHAKCAPIPPMGKESLIRSVWIKTKWLYE